MVPEDFRHLPYRPCVGVVLINRDGLIFAGQRMGSDPPAWQMPQGGIDKDETPEAAALRELHEETGIAPDHVTVLRETADWHAYDLPDEILPFRGKYRGQTQKWFLLRLNAPDAVIDLAFEDEEFSDWAWMKGAEVLSHIIGFKKPVYEAVLAEFGLV